MRAVAEDDIPGDSGESVPLIQPRPSATAWTCILNAVFPAQSACAHLQAGRNPSLYGIKPGETLDAQLENRLLGAIGSLVQHGLVRLPN